MRAILLAAVALAAAPASAVAAYAPHLTLTFSDVRPLAAPGVIATLHQGGGESTTKLIAARFPPTFTFNPAFAVKGCGGEDLAQGHCPQNTWLGQASARSVFGEASGPVALTSDFRIFIAFGAYEGLVRYRVFGAINPLDDGSAEFTIDDLPAIPITESRLELFGGSRAVFVNPRRCGRYQVGSRLESHDGDVVEARLPLDIAPCHRPVNVTSPAIAPRSFRAGASAVLRWRLAQPVQSTDVTLLRRAGTEWLELATRHASGAAGTRRLRVGPRWAGRALAPGDYRAVLRTRTTGGGVGPARSVPFRVTG